VIESIPLCGKTAVAHEAFQSPAGFFPRGVLMNPLYLSPAVLISYDGENADGAAGAPVPKPTQPPANPADRRFTQEDLNRLLGEDRRKHQGKIDQIQQTLERVSASKNLDVQEREQLQQQLEALEAEKRTKEQQLAHEKKQLEEQMQKRVKEAENDRKAWETKYKDSLIDGELATAAHRADAFSIDQFVRQLRPLSRAVEVSDEKTGKPTGKFKVVIDFPDRDESGAVVTRELSSREATKRMKEQPDQWGNFFRANVVSGVGSGSGGGTPSGNGKIDVRKLTQQQYMEIREKNPELLGLRPNKKGKSGR